LLMMLYCKTIGKIFADVRNLGYTTKNILVAGRFWYFNKPGHVYKGKSLEAAWHRATLDLLAAVALIDRGRLAGKIISYKAGHALDVEMIRELYRRDLLVQICVNQRFPPLRICLLAENNPVLSFPSFSPGTSVCGGNILFRKEAGL
jgi:UDP-3-O-acyl-N-acetylglucosamine deacetylase